MRITDTRMKIFEEYMDYEIINNFTMSKLIIVYINVKVRH